MTRLGLASLLAIGVLSSMGCDDDAPASADASVADGAIADAPATIDAGPQASVARGEYLVNHVAICTGCHTPRDETGAPIAAKYLSGVECFIDAVPEDGTAGCLSSRNLTNHATGLMNRSDAEIKNMFRNGVRPDGTALIPVMPYYVFHNMTDVDADSVVMYLRTVTGVEHTLPANQPPFNTPPPQPAAVLDPAAIPVPSTVNEHTSNGRYLASMAGVCIECHTTRTSAQDPSSLDPSKWFAGGEAFPAAAFGLPSPPFPEIVYTANLTPHASGLAGWTQAQVVAVLKDGVDRDGKGVCPPMPGGPMAEFGGLTVADANDIAAYILALPPIDNTVPNGCAAP